MPELWVQNETAVYRLVALRLELKKGIGYFERIPNMVFALRRVPRGNKGKTKQVPTIRYKDGG